MLTRTQVLPFLDHQDQSVRLLATGYFEQMGDAAPPGTADALWQAYARFGHTTYLVMTEASSYFHAIRSVGPSPQIVTSLLEMLRREHINLDLREEVELLIQDTQLALLSPHLEDLTSLLSPGEADTLNERVFLSGLDAAELWDRLEKLAAAAEDVDTSDEVEHSTAGRLVEALCRHPDFAIPNALARVRDDESPYYACAWSIDILGKLRHAPAIETIIASHQADSGDFIGQSAVEALGRMPAGEAVPAIEKAFASADDEFDRMSFAEALALIKDPLSEAAVLRFMPGEQSGEAFTGLCTALCDLCTTTGLEALRQAVIEQRYLDGIDDIDDRLVALCAMTGFAPPELEQWKKEIAKRSEAARRQQARMGRFLEEGWDSSLDSEDSATDDVAPNDGEIATYRREAPKIGRNDPCPCGSGKKYKKCCGQ